VNASSLTRSDDGLAQVGRTPQESDLGEVRTEAAALAGDDMAGRAGEIPVDGGAPLRVAGNAILCHPSERSHVGDELLQLARREPPDARHRGVRNAIRNHARQRDIVRRVVEPRAIEAGRVAAGAAGAMALDAHALEEPLAAVDVGVVLRPDSRGQRADRQSDRARAQPSFGDLHGPQSCLRK
jgi:hypothetical protein